MNHTFTLRQFCLLFAFSLLTLQAGAQTRPKYRTFDGTLNNLTYPQFGKSGIPLFREIPAAYGTSDPKNALGGQNRPTPRAISNKLSNEPEDVHNKRDMAGLFYSWGQFLDHDITLTPTNAAEKAPISLPSDEKIFTSPIPFSRSAAHPGTGVTTPREQTNLQTSWVDGSQVYGWTPAIANWLRTFSGGKMKVSKGNLLPFNTVTGEYDSPLDLTAPKMDDDNGRTKKTFAAGDPRAAEHPGLTSLHTLFVREHNQICNRLISQGLTNDEEIYQRARREVIAELQAITYGQWISSLGVQLTSYSGYKSSVRPDVRNTFSTAAYRWHTMVENDIIFRDNDCHGVGPSELPLKEVFFNIEIVRKYDIGVLLKGLSVHRSYETDLKVNSGLRNFLFGPGSGLDLVSLNIQRGRDHGLPDYNTVRQFYTGTPALTFTDISGSSRTSTSSSYPLLSSSSSGNLVSSELQSLYGNVFNIDLWAGLYAEPLMSGKSVGKTVHAILRTQLQALRDGDYYYYMNDPELINDRTRLAATKLGDVIARNSTAGNFQDNVFYRKSCSSEGDDIAHYDCSVTPQFDGWTFIGKTGSKTYYKWNGANANYYDAFLLAKRLGGHLPRISNATENNTLKNFLAGGSTWLDMNRNSSSQWQYTGIFNVNDVFVPGILAPYFSWNAGEPNNLGGSESAAEMTYNGQWSDVSPLTTRPVIAEVPCSGGSTASTGGCSGVAATFYTDCYRAGQSLSLGVGTYTYAQLLALGFNENTISDVVINPGFTVTLYDYSNFTGLSVVLTSSTNCLTGVNFNDKTTSIKIECGTNPVPLNPCVSEVVLYSDCYKAGKSISLPVGSYTTSLLSQQGFTDKTLSDLVIPPGFTVYLYEYDYFVGPRITLTSSTNCLSSINYNDRMSSIVVHCPSTAVYSSSQNTVSLEASAEPNRTNLQWFSNLNSSQNDYFIVQKLNTDSQTFDDLALVNNTNGTTEFKQFIHYDNAPTEGDNFYRIVAVLKDGSTKESETKKVTFGKFSAVNIYPNPATSEVNVKLTDYKDSPVSIYLYNSLGQPLLTKHADAGSSDVIQLDVSDIPVGQYLMRVASKGKKDVTKNVSVSH